MFLSSTRASRLRRAVLAGLVGLALLLSAVEALGVPTQAASAAPAAPRTAPVATASAYAVIATIPTPFQATHLALAHGSDSDPRDDTLFVATDQLYVYSPLAGTGSTWTAVTLSGNVRALTTGSDALFAGVNRSTDDTLLRLPLTINGPVAPLATAPLGEVPQIAVTGPDDSVYVTYYNNRPVVDIFTPDLAATRAVPLPGAPQGPTGLAASDDTIYATAWEGNGGYLSQVFLSTSDSEIFRPGVGATSVTVSTGRVLLGTGSSNLRSLRMTDWDDSVTAAFRGEETATWSGKVFATDASSSVVTVAPIASLVAEQSISVSVASSFDGDILVAGDGVAYVSRDTSGVAVLGPASASLATPSGPAGSTVRLNITLPAYRLMDDSTVTAVWWGDDTVPFDRVAGSNAVTVTAPSGGGSVPLVVALNGGAAVSGGNFTYGTAPDPTPPGPMPPVPSAAPFGATAVPGDRSATVSWSSPTTSGSFPVTSYLVTSSADGKTCLTPSLSCTVSGLTNGAAYTFTVQALTGAGWSPASAPSNAVTPRAAARPTIVITGAREGRLIVISGATTGMGPGGLVTPWTARAGAASVRGREVPVSVKGDFAWSRRAGAGPWRIYFTADEARSNTVTIR